MADEKPKILGNEAFLKAIEADPEFQELTANLQDWAKNMQPVADRMAERMKELERTRSNQCILEQEYVIPAFEYRGATGLVGRPPIWDEFEKWEKDPNPGFVYPLRPGRDFGFNGYAFWKSNPPWELLVNELHRIVSEVECHGGVTWDHVDEHGLVIGFDTAHYNSGQFPIDDVNWTIAEIKRMIDSAIEVGALFRRGELKLRAPYSWETEEKLR